MESGQCLEDIPGAKITKELCLPPMDMVAKHVLSLIQRYGTRSVFVASDVPPDVHGLKEKLGSKVRYIIFRFGLIVSSDFVVVSLTCQGMISFYIASSCTHIFLVYATHSLITPHACAGVK